MDKSKPNQNNPRKRKDDEKENVTNGITKNPSIKPCVDVLVNNENPRSNSTYNNICALNVDAH